MSPHHPPTMLELMQHKLLELGKEQIPLIGFVQPELLHIDDQAVKVKIPLEQQSKNHLDSMYFGALAVGADLAGGLQVIYFQELLGLKVSFSFKSMQADFIKRAESDVVFTSNMGPRVQKALLNSQSSGERINSPVKVEAANTSEEQVAGFAMTISVKVIDS